jgi:GNAT superfamily N-acetyltransferase
MQVTFTVAKLADVDTLAAFMRELYAFDHIPFDERAAREAVAGLMNDESLGRVWLIQAGAETIGYVALTLDYSLEYRGRGAFIDELFVEEPYRGRGVGTQAIRFAEEACRALGLHTLHLEVERQNVRAHNLYRKMGFEEHDRYLMTKWLSGKR